MGRRLISAKLDIVFKKFFTDNKDMLQEFIADMLEIPSESIKEIIITNPELVPEEVGGKFSRLDLNLNVDDSLVNIEVQINSEDDFRDRTLFYWAKLYGSELKSGEDYRQLKKTITINIVDFNMFSGTDFHNEIVTSIKGTDEIFSDKFSMHFFELKKVGKSITSNNRRELWMHFFNADSEEDFEMLKQTNNTVIEKAVNVIYDMSEDTRMREMIRMREKALHDKASELAIAAKKGRAEGIISNVQNLMKNTNCSLEEALKMLSINPDEYNSYIKM